MRVDKGTIEQPQRKPGISMKTIMLALAAAGFLYGVAL